MNVLQVKDRYRKEVIQVSTWKHDINVQYLYDIIIILVKFYLNLSGKLILFVGVSNDKQELINPFDLENVHQWPHCKNCKLVQAEISGLSFLAIS